MSLLTLLVTVCVLDAFEEEEKVVLSETTDALFTQSPRGQGWPWKIKKHSRLKNCFHFLQGV